MRFEEDIVERWYILNGYLTARNIMYTSPRKKPGGKGRGEIDLLAVKLENGTIKDSVWCEVSVSVSAKFPFISRKRENIDDIKRLIIKKFFSKGAEDKVTEYLGGKNYRLELITSCFKENVTEILKDNLPRFNARLIRATRCNVNSSPECLEIEVEYNPSDPEIEVGGRKVIRIIPFQLVLNNLISMFKNREDFMKKNFTDPTMRAIQWLGYVGTCTY